jgi:hypothetical protein
VKTTLQFHWSRKVNKRREEKRRERCVWFNERKAKRRE